MTSQINRREFLRRGALALAATPLAARGDAAAATALPANIVDTHVHFYDPTRPQGVPWPPKDDATLYHRRMPDDFRMASDDLDIGGVIVVEASPWLADNQWILDLAKSERLIRGFIGNLTLGEPAFAENLQRLHADPIFRGVRINGGALAAGLGKGAFEDDLRRLADAGLTVDVVGNEAMLPDIVRLSKVAPGMNIVIDHLPFTRWDGDPEAMRKGLAAVGEIPVIYGKVSAVVRKGKNGMLEDRAFYNAGLEALCDVFGPDRVVYGSNWPVSDNISTYRMLFSVVDEFFTRKGAAAYEKYFWKNSLAAYRWVDRPA